MQHRFSDPSSRDFRLKAFGFRAFKLKRLQVHAFFVWLGVDRKSHSRHYLQYSTVKTSTQLLR